MQQNQIIQLKVSSKFKKSLQQLAESRGLPLSTYIKFSLIEQLKSDPLWNQLEQSSTRQTQVEEFIELLKK
jgi:antitoxin component of RelBE/YafQ-DinJ toxin-antitoxin module